MSGRDFRMHFKAFLPGREEPVAVKLVRHKRVGFTLVVWAGNRDVSHLDLDLPFATSYAEGGPRDPASEVYANAPSDYLSWTPLRRRLWIKKHWRLDPEKKEKDLPEITRRLRLLGLVALA
jgi:hypothetical protein